MTTANTPEENAAEFGLYLTTQYGILRRVFSYLPSCDVRRCAQVCQAWERASLRTMYERRAIECFWFSEKMPRRTDFGDADLTLSFSTLSKGEEKDEEWSTSKEVHNFLARYGVIALINDSPPWLRRNRVELPLTPRIFIRAGVRFPSWDGVTIKTLTLGKPETLPTEIETSLPQDMAIKALIFIVYANEDSSWYDSLAAFYDLMKKREKEIAIGGCRLDCAEEDESEAVVKCIVFSGSNLQAASCVLDNHCRTLKDITTRVEELSKNVVPAKHSVLLTFRCCDRQKVRRRYNYEPKQNVEAWETNALKTFFPGVPVVGCYGVGEFGTDCPRLATVKKPRLHEGGSLGIEYAFSTSLVYLGFK